MSATVVEMRCPERSYRLFGKVEVREMVLVEGNLIEFACRDCRTATDASAVFHRFDLAGRLVETEVVPADAGTTGRRMTTGQQEE